MAWQIEFDPLAVKQLKNWINQLRGESSLFLKVGPLKTPRNYGEATTGDLAGYWKYRIGDYRALVELIDERMTIYVIKTKHRSIVYK